MSYDLRIAARRTVDDLRDRARIARREGYDHLASYLDLQASRLEAPLLAAETAERRRQEEAATRRLPTP